MATGWYDYRGP